jgi:hypothetical protein
MTSAQAANFTLTSSGPLRWYKSSDSAERGFCGECGSNLFWRQFGRDTLSISAGTLDTPTHLKLEQHIFVGDKSDYYNIDDDAPQHQQWQ